MATAELVLETAIDALTRLTLVVANLLGELEAEIGEMARTTARRFRSLRRRVRTKRGRETTERDHRGEPRDGHAEQEARHQRDARLERALELSPRWADAARGFQRGRVERRRAGRRAGRGATLRRARRRREARHAASARGGRCDARPRGRQLGNGRPDAGRCACGGRDLMELSPWRTGGRRAWTTVEVQTLTECAARGMGTLAIWRSGCLPGRSEGAIRAAQNTVYGSVASKLTSTASAANSPCGCSRR